MTNSSLKICIDVSENVQIITFRCFNIIIPNFLPHVTLVYVYMTQHKIYIFYLFYKLKGCADKIFK